MSETPLEELYDPATVRAIEGWSAEGPTVEPLSAWRRAAFAGAVTTAFVTGVKEALEDDETQPPVAVEWGRDGARLEPVTLYLVPGEPRASVAIVRPWLL